MSDMEMKLNDVSFDLVSRGVKTLEIRLFDEKRQRLKLGDHLAFTNNGRKAVVKVTGLSRFATFTDLLQNLGGVTSGWLASDSLEKMVSDLRLIYSLEEEKRYGVVGIHLQLI